MQYSQMIKYIINKKAENTTLRFFVYPFLENTHNTSCNCPCPWLHPPTDNTSDRRTIGRKKHKGLSTLKLSCPHSCRFSFCFPAVQSPPICFSGDFRHFQGFPCLFPPSCYIYTCRMGIHPHQPPGKKPRHVRKSPTA